MTHLSAVPHDLAYHGHIPFRWGTPRDGAEAERALARPLGLVISRGPRSQCDVAAIERAESVRHAALVGCGVPEWHQVTNETALDRHNVAA